jgi:DNA topoisomerase-1
MPELKCSKSDAYFVLRDGALGLFLAAHTFPRSRETRAPQVADLQRHRGELDPKFHYLADARATDPDGNPTVIRFSRKTREHFLSSMKGEEWSSWNAYWTDGKWVEKKEEKDSTPTTRKTKTRTRKSPGGA